MAHELAHVLLVHATEVVCTGDLDRRANSPVEAEAAYLGGCILVPNEAAYRIAFSAHQTRLHLGRLHHSGYTNEQMG